MGVAFSMGSSSLLCKPRVEAVVSWRAIMVEGGVWGGGGEVPLLLDMVG